MFHKSTYEAAINDLRSLLAKIGRHEFRAYGYTQQIRHYRRCMRVASANAKTNR